MDITIVLPVYNRKGLVQRTLDSIPDTFNIIIIDNGSTDGSYEFCRQWMLNSHRKNVRVEREFQKGAAAARNKGLELCKTEWVYFFDSDDVFTGLPEKWDATSDIAFFPVNMSVNGKEAVRPYMTVASPYVHILNLMMSTQSVIYKTEWLRKIGGWNVECMMWDDWELGVRTLAHSPKVDWLTSKVYHHIFVHKDSITGLDFSSRYKEIIKTLGMAFDVLYDMENGTRKQQAVFALFLRCYIFGGQLLKEKNKDAANDVEEFIYDRFRVNKQSHKIGKLLRWYTSKGGRGAWKIAMKLVETAIN